MQSTNSNVSLAQAPITSIHLVQPANTNISLVQAGNLHAERVKMQVLPVGGKYKKVKKMMLNVLNTHKI